MLRIHNTLTKKKDDFEPLNPPVVTFYQCGPTVYWTQHIGNMRAMVLADLIRRSLDYLDYDVKFVRNYTDVGHLTSDEDEGEDKLEKGAKREGLTPQEIAQKYIDVFEADVAALNCLPPTYKPRATEYVPQMQEMVQVLIDKGFAYATDLAIYFDISKVKDYTRLSGQDLSKNISDAGRGDVGDPGKKNSPDFAVWFFKAGAHANAIQTWDHEFKNIKQPTLAGFPGWHIECSAMCKALLGDTIDIHMGGIEHVPVHHTNEIAQSEAANGVEFVKYWIHNEHLTVDGGKMSKSEGTAYSVSELIEKGYDPLVLRYFFLQAHYRSKQNFTWEALDAAKSGLEGLCKEIAKYVDPYHASDELNQWVDDAKNSSDMHKSNFDNYQSAFYMAIEDDLNFPEALSICFMVMKEIIPPAVKVGLMMNFDKVLGLGLISEAQKLARKEMSDQKEIPAEVTTIADERQQARQNKDWAKSDELRDEIAKLGYEIEDSKDGYKLKKI